jgi:hypothetical protein
MIPIFLNELSCNTGEDVGSATVLQVVKKFVRALASASRCERGICLVGPVALTKLTLCEYRYTLATVLVGNENKDVWRKVISLDDRSPWSSYPIARYEDSAVRDVTYEGHSSTGMLCAHQASSMVASFVLSNTWDQIRLPAELHCLMAEGQESSEDIHIPNLVDDAQIELHRELIESYGCNPSASAVVYEGASYDIRLFFNDHNPPHFHVTSRDQHSSTIARYAIQTLRPLKGGEPTSEVKREVLEWAASRQAALMQNWDRCRLGKFPFLL